MLATTAEWKDGEAASRSVCRQDVDVRLWLALVAERYQKRSQGTGGAFEGASSCLAGYSQVFSKRPVSQRPIQICPEHVSEGGGRIVVGEVGAVLLHVLSGGDSSFKQAGTGDGLQTEYSRTLVVHNLSFILMLYQLQRDGHAFG